MPIRSKHDRHAEDFTLYADLIQYKVIEMALDHYFKDVVEGNVPLAEISPAWWERQIVPERVTRFSKPWCVLFEALAGIRYRLTDQGIPLHNLVFDPDLKATVDTGRYGVEEVEWVDRD